MMIYHDLFRWNNAASVHRRLRTVLEGEAAAGSRGTSARRSALCLACPVDESSSFVSRTVTCS